MRDKKRRKHFFHQAVDVSSSIHAPCPLWLDSKPVALFVSWSQQQNENQRKNSNHNRSHFIRKQRTPTTEKKTIDQKPKNWFRPPSSMIPKIKRQFLCLGD